MVGKTPLVLAPLIVGFAVIAVAFFAGRWWERAGRRYAASFIDPVTYGELIEVVRRVLVPADVDQGCFLPEAVKVRAEKVLAVAEEQAARRVRQERRRRGW